MNKIKIAESSSFVAEPGDNGGFVVRIIREGKGSSATYTRELLEKSVGVFDNSLSFANHPVDGNPMSRSFVDIVGHIESTWYSEHEGFPALYGEYIPKAEHRATLEEYKDKIGLSIFTLGAAKEVDGELIVESFDPVDPYRSVDVVIAPGAGGSFAPLIESWKFREGLEVNRKEHSMDLAELTAKIEDLTEVVAKLVPAAPVVESLSDEDQAQAVADAVAQFAVAAEAVAKAEVSDIQREALIAKAKTGEDITADIATAEALYKSVVAEAAEAVKPETETNVRALGESAKSESFTRIKGWGK